MATRWRRIRCIAASAIVLSVVSGCSNSKPISEQDCGELASTASAINTTTSQGNIDFDQQREGLEKGREIARRVAELGGCPSEPTLRP